jgi:hypothetical protein
MPETSSSGTRKARATGPAFQDVEDVNGIKIADAPDRTKRAKEYEKKTNGILNQIMRICLAKENTVADGAAIINYGEAFSSKMGDLADQDERVRRGIDLITSGTENPYIALLFAAIPLGAQILRNHEQTEVRTERHIRIPFTKKTIRIPFKFRIKLGPRVRSMTASPDRLIAATLMNPEIMQALAEENIYVAWKFTAEPTMNGNGKAS